MRRPGWETRNRVNAEADDLIRSYALSAKPCADCGHEHEFIDFGVWGKCEERGCGCRTFVEKERKTNVAIQ